MSEISSPCPWLHGSWIFPAFHSPRVFTIQGPNFLLDLCFHCSLTALPVPSTGALQKANFLTLLQGSLSALPDLCLGPYTFSLPLTQHTTWHMQGAAELCGKGKTYKHNLCFLMTKQGASSKPRRSWRFYFSSLGSLQGKSRQE